MKKFLVFFAVVAATVVFSSCAKAPQVEMDAAVAALEQARAAQADVYMEAEYMVLQDSLNAVTAEIEAQKSKMFGSFGSAKEKLATISAKGSELVAKADARKEEVKAEVAEAQAVVVAMMDENQKMVEMAPKGKEGKEAIEAIKSDLASINASLAEIPALVDGNNLMAVQTKVNAVKQKATEINTELKTVLAKYNRK